MAKLKIARPRTVNSQMVYLNAISKIRTNWCIDALSAIPEFDGMRPASITSVSTRLLRTLASISAKESNISAVQTSLIRERNRRLDRKGSASDSDKLLAISDADAVFQQYKRKECAGADDQDSENDLDLSDGVYLRSESGRRVRVKCEDEKLPVVFRRLVRSSSSLSGTTIHSTIVVGKPEASLRPDDKKRRCPSDAQVISRGKRPKRDRRSPIRFDYEQQASQIEPQIRFKKPTSDKLVASPESVDLRLASTPTRKPSHTGSHDRLAPPVRKPLTVMLEKMVNGFTDNLFFLHGVLRTFEDTSKGQARAEALDAAATHVLSSLNQFRRTVETIDKGVLDQPALTPVLSPASTADARSPKVESQFGYDKKHAVKSGSAVYEKLPARINATRESSGLNLASVDPLATPTNKQFLPLEEQSQFEHDNFACARTMIELSSARHTSRLYRDTVLEQDMREGGPDPQPGLVLKEAPVIGTEYGKGASACSVTSKPGAEALMKRVNCIQESSVPGPRWKPCENCRKRHVKCTH